MNAARLCASALYGVSVLMLSACGGGGDGSPTQAGINGSGVSSSAPGSTGVAVGPITAFGSVFVNGVEFDINGSTSISVDGDSGKRQDDLRIGEVVEVRGTINTSTGKGVASSIAFDDNLQGVVTSISTTASTFVVMGQTVKVTGTTVLDGISDLSALTTNTLVEVSGFVDATGVVQATRVEVKTGTTSNELTAQVTAVTSGGLTVTLGTGATPVTVTYGASVVFKNGVPAVNQCVELKGTFSGSVFTATSVEAKSCSLSVTSGQRGEIEGLITTALSGSTFKIGTLTVNVGSSPSYVNGSAANLLAGAEVEVEGTFDASGVLVASKIEIKLGTSTRMTGFVESVNTTSGLVTLFNTPVTLNATTQMVDKLGASNAVFNVSNLRTGDYLEVRGYENQAHTAMTAVTLERRSDTRLEIQAFAQNVGQTSQTFKLMGATVIWNGTLPTANALVKVRGTWSLPIFTATSLQ